MSPRHHDNSGLLADSTSSVVSQKKKIIIAVSAVGAVAAVAVIGAVAAYVALHNSSSAQAVVQGQSVTVCCQWRTLQVCIISWCRVFFLVLIEEKWILDGLGLNWILFILVTFLAELHFYRRWNSSVWLAPINCFLSNLTIDRWYYHFCDDAMG